MYHCRENSMKIQRKVYKSGGRSRKLTAIVVALIERTLLFFFNMQNINSTFKKCFPDI